MSAAGSAAVSGGPRLAGPRVRRIALADRAPARPWRRSLTFLAFALYGVVRWARLMLHPPMVRLLALAALATAIAGLVPLARRRLPHLSRTTSAALGALLGLAMLPVAGLRWSWVTHLRVAVSARAIGRGLSAQGGLLLPYLGHAYASRLVMTLGAALLLLAAAVALAGGGRAVSDARRAAAALPLLALAVVPATLVPPALPVFQGFVLFCLLAAFVWGERVDGGALGLLGLAGVAAGVAAPAIAGDHAWLDYRDWTGSTPVASVDRFTWNQTYGPLRWPSSGHVVLAVRAPTGDYWKATDLSIFDGTDWVRAAASAPAASLPAPSAWARRHYTERDVFAVAEMDSREVITGSGLASHVDGVPGGVLPGPDPGTWIAYRPLVAGTSYAVTSYSPDPGPRRLRRAGGRYPWARLSSYLTLAIPDGAGTRAELPFAPFHTAPGPGLEAAVKRSPYAATFALARRLAASATTPYGFVRAVQRDLDSGRYVYDQNPPVSAYPLPAFLFDTHRGYCQQFSGAMALLLRMGGLPARVAAGFTSGAVDHETHVWTVSDVDAHAWVEVWFPRYGWVRFDPTPASAPARGGPRAGVSAAAEARLEARGNPFALRSAPAGPATPGPAATAPGSSAAGGRAGRGSSDGGPGPWPWLGGGALIVGLVVGVWWRARRGAVRIDPVAELERALVRTGRRPPPATTLSGLEARFRSSPEAAAYIRALRIARYRDPARAADGAPDPAAVRAARRAGGAEVPHAAGRRALRAELGAGLGWRGRARALWALPPRPPRPPRLRRPRRALRSAP